LTWAPITGPPPVDGTTRHSSSFSANLAFRHQFGDCRSVLHPSWKAHASRPRFARGCGDTRRHAGPGLRTMQTYFGNLGAWLLSRVLEREALTLKFSFYAAPFFPGRSARPRCPTSDIEIRAQIFKSQIPHRLSTEATHRSGRRRTRNSPVPHRAEFRRVRRRVLWLTRVSRRITLRPNRPFPAYRRRSLGAAVCSRPSTDRLDAQFPTLRGGALEIQSIIVGDLIRLDRRWATVVFAFR